MSYRPEPIGEVRELSDLVLYLQAQLDQISNALEGLQIKVYTTTPKHPTRPEVAIATGSWNPGAGPGAYIWFNDMWTKLG